MSFRMSSTGEAREHITQRLLDGWVAVIGNSGGIAQMEKNLYPPGTPKNADFELVGFLPSICLAKKTDEFQQWYPSSDFDKSDFDDLLAMTFHSPIAPDVKEGYTGWLVESTIFNADAGEAKADAIERLVLTLTSEW